MTFRAEKEQHGGENSDEAVVEPESEFCEIKVDLLKMRGDNAPTAVKFTQLYGSM